jgi:hypothetical protein
MHSASERQRIKAFATRSNVVWYAIDAPELMINERNIEVRIVNDELGTIDKREELLGYIGEHRFISEKMILDAMHLGCSGIDFSLGIDIALKRFLGCPAVDEFDATDLNNAMTRFRVQARGFRIEDDLSQLLDS